MARRAAPNIDGARLLELQKSGIVRPAAAPAVASRVVAAGDPLYRGMLPDGGFPAGYISEIRGNSSSGRLTLAVRALLRALDAGERAGLITSIEFFPGLSPGLATALCDVLVCRMRSLGDGLAAAEVLATSGAVDLLVLDVVGLHSSSDARIPDSTVARIERAARAEGIAIVVITNEATANAIQLGSKSAIRLETQGSRLGLPDGKIKPKVNLTRSRFARVESRESARQQHRTARR